MTKILKSCNKVDAAIANWQFRKRICNNTITIFIARQHTDARYWYSKSVCPSVRPSVRYVPVPDENGLTYRHSFFSPYGSPIILVLQALNIFTKFLRVTHCGTPCGALNTGGVEIIRDFLPISRYISQTIQNIAIVTMEGNRNSYAIYQIVPFPMTLNEP